MPGLAHLYSGEEAVAVGVCAALRRDDYITSTHRGHGHCLAKGASIDRMFAELLGKEAGYCKGKGGSMHIADQDTGNLGANAIVGGSAGIATGAAFSSKMAQDRSGHGLFLRRWRARPGCALRSDEHGFTLETAGHLCLRKQSLQRIHPQLRDDRRKPVESRGGVWYAHRRDRWPGCAGGLCDSRTAWCSVLARVKAPASCSPTPTVTSAITLAIFQRTYYRSQGRRSILEDAARSHPDP